MSLPHIDSLITDLPALQLENALPSPEQAYLPLRMQSRGFLLSALAQCRYLVHTWRVLKDSCPLLKRTTSKLSYASLPNLSSPSRTWGGADGSFTIGVIGCGRMGRHIVNKLLQDPNISPDMILISTRQPDLLEEFISQGVKCRFDNVWVANNSDVIFLACLPSHLSPVVNDLYRSSISRATLLVSLLAGVSSARVRRSLSFRANVTSVYFDWNQLDTEDRVLLSEDVAPEVRMSSRALCVVGCPFRLEFGVWFGELVLACLACCALHGVASREGVEVVHSLLADATPDFVSCIPGALLEKRGMFSCMENEEAWSENCDKLSAAVRDEKLRDVLVEKYWQRVRENEPSLLDLARASASTKSL